MVAMSVNCVMSATAILAAVTMRIILVRLNRKLERGEYVEGAINNRMGDAGKKGFRFRI